jgi:hypothetical protein
MKHKRVVISTRVFQNEVMRTVFEPMKADVTGGHRELRKEELHNLYTSPSSVSDEACSRHDGDEKIIRHLCGKGIFETWAYIALCIRGYGLD